MFNIIFWKKTLLYFVLISSVLFFSIIVIPQSLLMGVNIIVTGIILFLLVFSIIYFKDNYTDCPKSITWPIVFIFLGMFLSMITANVYHRQQVLITMFAQKDVYFYLFYFLLHYIRPTKSQIIKSITVIGALYLLLFFTQYLIYPRLIIGGRVSQERGTIRIFFAGGRYALLVYFLLLHQVLTKKVEFSKIVYILAVFIAVAILSGTRQMMATVTLTTGLFVLLSKRVKSRVLIMVIMLIGVVCIFFIFQDIFQEIIALTQKQSSGGESVRSRAMKFYLGEFMPSKIAYIFGNGAPHGSSMYGVRVNYYKTVLGFYQSDVGIIGDYSRFGVFYVLAVLIFFFKIFFSKLPESLTPIRYFYLIVFLTIATGAGFFGTPEGVVINCLIWYMVDIARFEETSEKEASTLAGKK